VHPPPNVAVVPVLHKPEIVTDVAGSGSQQNVNKPNTAQKPSDFTLKGARTDGIVVMVVHLLFGLDRQLLTGFHLVMRRTRKNGIKKSYDPTDDQQKKPIRVTQSVGLQTARPASSA
jgi:hypothetical protein